MSKRIRISCNRKPQTTAVDYYFEPSVLTVEIESEPNVKSIDLSRDNAVLLAKSILEYYKGD